MAFNTATVLVLLDEDIESKYVVRVTDDKPVLGPIHSCQVYPKQHSYYFERLERTRKRQGFKVVHLPARRFIQLIRLSEQKYGVPDEFKRDLTKWGDKP